MNDWFDAEQHVERAHDFYQSGRWDDAVSELRRAIALNPYQGEWHFNLGLTLNAAGRHRDAMDAFGEASRLEPSDPQPLIMVGLSHMHLDEPRSAIPWFEQAGKLEPASSEPLIHRIEAHARLGEYEQAELAFYLAQQVDASNPDLYAAMADVLLDRREFERAIWCLREASKLDPELPGMQARLAEAYAALGRPERARQLYLLELRQNPGDTDTLLELADLLASMNRPAEAQEKAGRVLELEPEHVGAHLMLGKLADQSGDARRALRHLEVVLRLDASLPRARTAIAHILLRERDPSTLERARVLLDEELSLLARDDEMFENVDLSALGQALLSVGWASRAVDVFRRLTERDANDAGAFHDLSVACFEADRSPDGIEAALSALKLEPRMLAPMHNLAVAYFKTGRLTRARYWVKRALSIDSEDHGLRRMRAVLAIHGAGELIGRMFSGLTRRLVLGRRRR